MSSSFFHKINQLDTGWTRRLRVAERPGLLRGLMIGLAHSGDSWIWLPGLGLVWLFGNDGWRARAAVMGAAALFLAFMVLVIKFLVRRKRPEGEWGAIYRKTDPHSFPSGHAARAALLAVLALGMGPSAFGWVMATWAPLVVLARVAMGVHYLSDVLAGAFLGVVVGVMILYGTALFP